MQIAVQAPLPQLLDLVARQGFAGQHHFKAIVIRWIVATRYADAGLGSQLVGSEINNRGGDPTDINDVNAASGQAGRQCIHQLRTGQSTISADNDTFDTAINGFASNRLANHSCNVRGEGLSNDAANVVGLENFIRQGSRVNR